MNKQLRSGIKIESEHKRTISYIKKEVNKTGKFPSNAKIFKKIASDHLKEDKNYYKKLIKAKL